MATFKEWQVANLTAEEQAECNNLCIEFESSLEAAGADLSGSEPVWTSEEAKAQFGNSVNSKFTEYFTRYELSK